VGRILPAVVVLALLGCTAAAFAVTESLKLERAPVFDTKVGKVVAPDSASNSTVPIQFQLRKPGRITIEIVNGSGEVIRTLVRDRGARRGTLQFTWDGRNDAHEVVPDGTYRPRVHLAREHRTILLPNPIAVDTKVPHISLTRTSLKVVSPDGDAIDDYLTVFFHTSEPARAVLYANGRRVVKVKSFSAHSLKWGKRNGMPTKPGVYRLWLRSIDAAGNPGPRTPIFRVQIRYIELGRNVILARAGGAINVRVSTDARFYYWRIGPRHGRVGNRHLSLAAGAPGRYQLVVSERGHKAHALFVVTP
jgi:hypothetical protein